MVLACRLGAAGEKPSAEAFINYLIDKTNNIDAHFARRLAATPPLPQGDEVAARQNLIATYACDVTAAEAVPPALGAFLAADSFEWAVALAVSLGGDTDTIGAMAGALAGVYWGVEAVPSSWFDALENGERGRDYVLSLCRKLADKMR